MGRSHEIFEAGRCSPSLDSFASISERRRAVLLRRRLGNGGFNIPVTPREWPTLNGRGEGVDNNEAGNKVSELSQSLLGQRSNSPEVKGHFPLDGKPSFIK